MTTTATMQEPITSPWVLVDDLTAQESIVLLEHLTHWLDGPDQQAASACARTVSNGQTGDPEAIADQAHALAARLRQCTQKTQLHTRGWTIHP